MKKLKGNLLILLLSLACFTSLSAQTDAERKFMASVDSLNTQFINAYTGKVIVPAAYNIFLISNLCVT